MPLTMPVVIASRAVTTIITQVVTRLRTRVAADHAAAEPPPNAIKGPLFSCKSSYRPSF